jgi:hypothetical protein
MARAVTEQAIALFVVLGSDRQQPLAHSAATFQPAYLPLALFERQAESRMIRVAACLRVVGLVYHSSHSG